MIEQFETITTERGPVKVKAGPYATYVKARAHSPSRQRWFFIDGSHATKGIKAHHAWDIVSADGARFLGEQVDIDDVLKHMRKAGGLRERLTGESTNEA